MELGAWLGETPGRRAQLVLGARACGWSLGLITSTGMLNTAWGGAGLTTFAWHPVLMALAVPGLMTEGLLAHYSTIDQVAMGTCHMHTHHACQRGGGGGQVFPCVFPQQHDSASTTPLRAVGLS